MSGGSFDYMYSEMEGGDSAKFSHYAAKLESELERLAFMIDRLDLDSQSKAMAEFAVPTVMRRVAGARRLIEELGREMTSLANVAQAAEWWCSCDYGPDQVAEACIRWMYDRLGVPMPKKGDPK